MFNHIPKTKIATISLIIIALSVNSCKKDPPHTADAAVKVQLGKSLFF